MYNSISVYSCVDNDKMPYKPKQGEIISCDMCGCSFAAKDLSVHEDSPTSPCDGLRPLDLVRADSDTAIESADKPCRHKGHCLVHMNRLKHPVMYENRLLGKRHSIKSPEAQKPVVCIYLHPAVMYQCGFCFGGVVMVNRCVACKAFPNTSVPVGGVGMDAYTMTRLPALSDATDYVLVEAMNQGTIQALNLRCTSGFEADEAKMEQFAKFVIKSCVGCYVSSGSVINIDYYGQEHSLVVESVIGTSTTDTDINNADSSMLLCETMKQKCSLTDSTSNHGNSTHAQANNQNDCVLVEKNFYVITKRTTLEFVSKHEDSDRDVGHHEVENFGGYLKEVGLLKEMISNQLFLSSALKSQGLLTPKGVLLYGPSGSGKTLLAATLARHFSVNYVVIKGADVWSKFYGETEATLKKLFQKAKNVAPSILLLDDVGSLCPNRGTSQSETEKRVAATLLSLLDGLNGPEPVFVLATTNHRNNLDPGIRRPGRLDTEIEIGGSSVTDRCQILEVLLRRFHHTINDAAIMEIANRTHGFLGSDLAALCKEGMMLAIRSGDQTENITLTADNLTDALQNVKPSAMKEVLLEISKVSWSDIGGQDDLKHKLCQAVEWPLRHPEAFKRLGIQPPRGLLMYGPPGCSKTMVARALAKESGLSFIAIKGPELFSKWVGESERAVRDVFTRAKAAAPAIVFFDEIDALATSRGGGDSGGGADVASRVLAQLLTEMDGVETIKDVLVVAATNRPDLIDKALLRPGRLDRLVYVPLPDTDTRRAIFNLQFKKTPVADDVNMEELATKTEGYSGAEVTAVCHEAALYAMEENIEMCRVHRRHLMQALAAVSPRVTSELLAIYDKYHAV